MTGNAEELEPRRIEQGGSALFDARRIRVLEALAKEVKDWMGNRTVTLAQVGQFVSSKNFRNLALEARLNMKAPVANFLRAFPDMFDVTTNKDGRSSVKGLNITPPALLGRRLRKKTRVK